ncbi:MAG: PAS domain-containing sensor histidine kinase [Deltaproteobacteria bacterium]|nr:PAS domain-containing sensor histidine kinase [Deltaproteobacteria bacterium]
MTAQAPDPELFSHCFKDSSDAIVLTDTDGRIVAANRAWLDLYGYALDEVVGKTTRLIKSEHSTREVYEHMWAQIRDPERGFWKGELVNRKRSGEEVPILLTINPIRHEGRIAGYTGIGIDLSERRRFDQMRELYELVVRHDLKAPLSSMMAVIDTMLEGFAGEVEPEQRRLLGVARAQASRMNEMIETSLDLEKLKERKLPLHLADVDLFAAIAEAAATLSYLARRLGIVVDLRAADRPVAPGDRLIRKLDPIHARRIFENLLKNAVEASPRNGVVTVTLDEPDGAARVRVANGGEPILPHVRATLFHPFSTYGKQGGSGLGVYGVKLLTEAMGGRVSFESGESGTVFEIVFP